MTPPEDVGDFALTLIGPRGIITSATDLEISGGKMDLVFF